VLTPELLRAAYGGRLVVVSEHNQLATIAADDNCCADEH
jgi:hypothetical protein